MALRVFIVLATVFLVAAVAMVSAAPASAPLSETIARIDPSYLPDLQRFELSHFSNWAWALITVPLLVRPAWLPFLCAGLLCLGVCVSLGWRRGERPVSGRRR